MAKKEITTIKLEKSTKERLDRLKEYDRESYNGVIRKLLHVVNTFRKNPTLANKILNDIDRNIKRNKVYLSIPKEENKEVKKEKENDR